jgi:hypothetical protein
MAPGRDTRLLRDTALTALCGIALLQILLGLAGLLAAALGAEWTRPTHVRDWQRAVEILAFGALAAHLLLGARRDARAEYLGALLLLIALFFAHPPILALANALPPGWREAVLGFRAITVDAFTPALAWLFVRDFPRALEWPRVSRFTRSMIALSLFAAAGLVAANVAISIRGEAGALAPFARTDPYGHYWTIVFGLLLPALPFAIWRTRHAPGDERRRVMLFAGGLAAAGIAPVLVAVLPPLFPQLRSLTAPGSLFLPFNLVMILAVAATTTYSVVVEHVLDVRTVLRMAAQYWLTSVVVALLAAIPFAILLRLLYEGRDEPLRALLFGSRGPAIVGLLIVGVTVLRLRRSVMLADDRIVFREPYDPQRVLGALTIRTQPDTSVDRLARSIVEQVGAAIHPESIGILVNSLADQAFVPVGPPLRSLPHDSALAERLRGHGAPIAVDLARPAEPLRDLPEADRVWLGDAGAAMLVPLVGASAELEGLLALGPKRSELPYSRADHQLLQSVADAASLGLENRRLRGSGSAVLPRGAEERASECVSCGCVGEPSAASCGECAKPVRESALPRDLFGKFHVQRRIGQGGMGVVYGAVDIALDRPVALKTLPRTSPEDAERLRREARAMAAVTHPNLALILGAETWQGTPILVLEYLGGGTLESRLRDGPLPLRRTFEIAACLASVLERLHGSGLLHRDVKPSNVGFSEAGDPKLLDFGLVRILRDVVAPRSVEPVLGAMTETGFAGTPLYMSPEALASGRPGPGFDLWGLAVVAFEALTGVHPFERASSSATFLAIRDGWSDANRSLLPEDAGAVAAFFESALAADAHRRPSTAAELTEQIGKVLTACP